MEAAVLYAVNLLGMIQQIVSAGLDVEPLVAAAINSLTSGIAPSQADKDALDAAISAARAQLNSPGS